MMMVHAFHPIKLRRGIATVLVLGILAIAMALSYSVMRSQTTAVQLQTNTRRAGAARLAALTGVSAALRKMHETGWAGVGTALTGSISATDRYSVTYTTGDSSLNPSHPDYGDYPYRVTLSATGQSDDPISGITASHRIRVVVRLNPRRTADPVTGWATAQAYTVFQRVNDAFSIDVPARIEGPVRVQGTFEIGRDFGWSTSARNQYMGDLNAKRLAQGIDYRPFSNRVDIPTGRISSDEYGVLTSQLAVQVQYVAQSEVTGWPFTGTEYKYRLYPGGKEYTAGTISSTVANTSIAPDPMTNPIGVFFAAGPVTIGNNTTFQGTLVTTGSGTVTLNGSNITLSPQNLTPLTGSTLPTRLPTVVASDDFMVSAGSQAAVTGFVIVGDDFEVDEGSQSSSFALTGRLSMRGFQIDGRSEFDAADWDGLLTTFVSAVKPVLPGALFPDWLQSTKSLNSQPRITIKAEGTTPVATYHWSPTAPTIFVPDPADPGMRWDLISWSDGTN